MPDFLNQLKFGIIIPAYNEEKNISQCLDSLVKQNLKPQKIIVVDDSSIDDTAKLIKGFERKHPSITYVRNFSDQKHLPGQKVISAFNKGLQSIDLHYFDIICKFDADLIFPPNYLSGINQAFLKDATLGLCGGVCTINKHGNWIEEKLTNADHVRGALKAYRVRAFRDIDSLQSQMGWDTADEFKLRFKNWKVKVITKLNVKHLKPTAEAYQDAYFEKQGHVFYALRYDYLLTAIAALKISKQRNQLLKFKIVLKSYRQSKKQQINYLLTEEEGQFLRRYRWRQIWRKVLL
ncbi:glycosyltransferase family 2 protein [Mesohalobacter halotolerans]|uniref:Glycosyltransferase family 2 protein n=1 Tax=Mesohalobacter halotolerans TaxID=1883405 RepID=A0A4U5TPK6_9FLAO|nr:glycosyltransferase family 2 protein [Mesohalobacter halotolerans]MBS3737956.1 glycosyltransferase family 2 protein [Psychroflexus sp.]TKS56060.1 glycosyltransferase family 2 protein [Mesohalobacter halotolerans]